MDTPVRKYQKQKDYQRHKLFRKMKRRRRAAIEQAKDAPMKQLRRKLKMPKFEDGKDESTQKAKRPVTTGGAGYIPDYSTHNSIEGLKRAVYDYYTGGLPVEEVRNRLYNNVSPYGYFDVSHRIRSAVRDNIPFKKSDDTGYFEDLREGKDPKIDSRGYSPKRDDIFAEYLQIPKNKRHSFPNDSGVKLIKSKYAPTIGKENNSYLALRLPDNYKESLVRAGENVLMGKNQLFVTKPLGDFLGEHTVGKGYDSKGEYISYYDKWDLDPFFYRQGERDITMGIGKPVNIYDRIYLDDYYGVKQPTHATYLPEVTVYGKKKKGSTFNKGKDDKPNVFQLADGTFVNSHNEPLEVLDYAGVEDPTKWTYVDKKGNRYTPKATRTLTEGEQFTQRQIENEQNTRPFEFTPYIEGANEGAAAASLMMGFPFNMAGSAYYTAKASRNAYNRNYLGAALNGLGAVTPAGSGIYDRIKLAIENYRQPLKKLESPVIRTVQDNGKIRLSLPTHTDSNPRQFVLEPQGNNKFYVHMRTWDGDHVPANLSNEDKQTLFQALYDELPDGAEILFPKSGPGYYGTRGTVAGLQRLARDSRFTPGTKGTLQYLDKDGKTVKTYEGTSFIKTPRITAENAANIIPETIRLYHGSPVRFNTFSANFIGSGEGGSKVMRGINLWPEEKIGNAPKLANIKSPDAPMHLGVSSTPLGGELNPTVYDVLGKDLKLYKAAPREVKSLKQEDLVKQGYDGVQTPNQVTVFPESIHKLSIDKQSSIEDFVMSHPEVERWTPWTTDMQKMQNIIDMSRMSKYTPEQWTAAQDAAIARGDVAEAQRLRDLHQSLTPTATSGKYYRGTKIKRNSYPDRHIDEEVGEMNGIYLTKKPKYAKTYGDVEEFYLRSNNPLETEGSWTGIIDDATRAEIENAGYDAVVNNRFDTGFLNKLLRNSRDETITFNGKNLKSADAVTFDDNGVRIPLGERDNFNINDIRYGLLPFGIGLTGYGLWQRN